MARNLSALFLVLHLVDGAGKNVLISTEAGVSASTDTPASVPYRPLLKPGTRPVEWMAVKTDQTGDGGRREGWIDVGGVNAHIAYTFSVANPADPTDDTRPLDDLVALDFRRQPAIWYACSWILDPVSGAYSVPALADCEIVGRGTVNNAQFQDDSWIIRIRDQTSEGANVPAAPVEYQGLGSGIQIRHNGIEPGAEIRRTDQASIRTTGDQWFSWIFFMGPGISDATPYLIFSSSLCRIHVVSNTLRVQQRDSAAVWTTVGTPPALPAGGDLFGLLLNYDSGTTTGEVFVDAISQGSSVISGGLNTTATLDTVWQNPGTAIAVPSVIYLASRHGNRKLAANELLERSLFAFDILGETALTMAMEFDEGIGDITADSANIAGVAGRSGALSSFADTEAAWIASDTGEAPMAHTRPFVTLGRAFDGKGQQISAAFQRYTTGYDGGTQGRAVRWVAADGGRLKGLIEGTGVDPLTFVSATRQIDKLPLFNSWLAVGQQFTTASGLNPGPFTVEQVLQDPVTQDPQFGGVPSSIIVKESLTDETVSVAVNSLAADEDYLQAADIPSPGYAVTVGLFTLTERIAISVSGNGNDTAGRLAPRFLSGLGPEVTATETNLRSLSLSSTGWQGEGNQTSRVYLEDLARSTMSGDSSPSVVSRDLITGAWSVRGFDRTPTAPTLTWNADRIRTASEISPSRTFDAVRMQYAREWSHQDTDAAALPPGVFGDRYSAEISTELLEVTSGTGRELVVEVFLLETADAQAAADALQDIISNGILYRLELYGPLPKTEVSSVPFEEVTVTWPTHSFLSSGRVGSLVGLTVHPDFSATALALFIGP